MSSLPVLTISTIIKPTRGNHEIPETHEKKAAHCINYGARLCRRSAAATSKVEGGVCRAATNYAGEAGTLWHDNWIGAHTLLSPAASLNDGDHPYLFKPPSPRPNKHPAASPDTVLPPSPARRPPDSVSYTHLRAHETRHDL